jgi:hypothetical protein
MSDQELNDKISKLEELIWMLEEELVELYKESDLREAKNEAGI